MKDSKKKIGWKNSFSTFFLGIALFFALPAFSATQKLGCSGKVYDSNKQPLYYAVVYLEGTAIYSMTQEDGTYQLKNIVPGKYTLIVSILGYQTVKKKIDLQTIVKEQNFYLNEQSLALDEVVIYAEAMPQSKNGTSSYKINSEAIKQVQTMSVGDILQLLPGSEVSTPNLKKMSQVNLRNAGNYGNINAFGTAIIVDGNQLSNDANMNKEGQISTVNRGIDLREISASSVESVEVISGVPSAKYGNVTSGAVIINRKSGYTPWHFTLNSTPESYQIGANKGFRLKNGDFLNTDVDYTYSNSSPTSRKKYFQRINAGVHWAKKISEKLEWNNNLFLRYGFSFDGERDDPDEVYESTDTENKTHNISLTTNGSLHFLGRLNYSLSGNYSYQYAYDKESMAGPVPIIESLEAGTHIVPYSPITFYQRTENYGEPVNFNGRIEATQSFETYGFHHNLSEGVSFSFDKNYGKGRVLDDENNAVTFLSGSRKANFYNAPATKVYSAYLQNDINLQRENAYYLFKLGLRYDNMLEKYNLLSPRISLSGKYFDKLRLRVAYGISYRTPSIMQMYPGPRYFDVINLNHYSEDDARSLAVVTTYIYQPTNKNIKPSKGQTLEVGIDFEPKGWSISVTGFYKKLTRGIYSADKLLTFGKMVWKSLGEVTGQMPELIATDSIVRVSSSFTDYKNTITSDTRGIEYTVKFPKIAATNTTIDLSGSFLWTKTHNESLNLRSSVTFSNSSKNWYGLYEQPTYMYKRGRSTVTIAQHFPKVRMMLTLRTEVDWLSQRRVINSPSSHAYAYYDVNGNYYEIPEENRANAEYKDLQYPVNYYNTEPIPTYCNFHLQLRKETKQGHSFSFYANNFLWYNPTYHDENNNIVYLNSKITLGVGLTFKF